MGSIGLSFKRLIGIHGSIQASSKAQSTWLVLSKQPGHRPSPVVSVIGAVFHLPIYCRRFHTFFSFSSFHRIHIWSFFLPRPSFDIYRFIFSWKRKGGECRPFVDWNLLPLKQTWPGHVTLFPRIIFSGRTVVSWCTGQTSYSAFRGVRSIIVRGALTWPMVRHPKSPHDKNRDQSRSHRKFPASLTKARSLIFKPEQTLIPVR